jgi:hypothetical protein
MAAARQTVSDDNSPVVKGEWQAMRHYPRMLGIFGLAAVVLMAGACAMFEKGGAEGKPEPKRLPDNYEFDDVLIPRELDLEKSSSFVYRSEGLKAGLLRFSGRVETTSLMRFFANNMPKDGWRMISQFRSPQSLMLFQKGNRMAVIAIEDADFRTYVDVWVVPMNESIDAGAK